MAKTRSRLSGTKRSLAIKRRSGKTSKSSIENGKSTRRNKSNKRRVSPRTRISIKNYNTRMKKQLQQEKNVSSSKEKNLSSSNKSNLSLSNEKIASSLNTLQRGKSISSNSRKRTRTDDRDKITKSKNSKKNKKVTKSSIKKENAKPKDRERNNLSARSLSDFINKPSEKKRNNATPQSEANTPPGERVAYIHVGEGGEADLQAQQRGTENLDIEVLEEELLPDIDERDMIHGLDHTGTARDYVDARHRCTRQCPEGCQGQLRPNEIVIYESFKFEGRLQARKRYRGRIVRRDAVEGREEGCRHDRREASRRNQEGCRFGRREVSRRNEEGCQHTRREISRGHGEGCRHSRRDIERNGEGRRVRRERNSNHEITKKKVSFPEMPARTELVLSLPPVSREVQLEHAWNINDRSLNISLKEDDELTFQRHPVAQSTDAIRTKVSYSSGIHAWEVTWPVRHRGTHAVVGVATKEASLYTVGYQSLIGINQESWGWDLGRMKSYHDSQNVAGVNYPGGRLGQELGIVPEKFKMVLDMEAGTLGFVVGGKYLGVAHVGLRGRKLFPAVSSVWGRCEITLRYLGGMEQAPVPLMYLCRRVVRRAVGEEGLEEGRVEKLRLPNIIKKYLQ